MITKCDAGPEPSCPFKYTCRRFLAPVAKGQTWLDRAPYDPGVHMCPEFVSVVSAVTSTNANDNEGDQSWST